MFPKSLVAISFASVVFSAPLTRRAALDFGSCSNPTIIFANGLDGRNQPSFEPANEASFNHGSALNIGVISSFICGQLQSACKANQAAIDACNAGEQASAKLTGQAAADAFNKAITGGSNTSAASAPPPAETSAASVTVTVAAAEPTATESTAAAATSAPSTVSSSSTDSSASSGQNLQTFTGDLGGLPPPVTAGGKGFITDNSQFLNLAAALGRSCDVQHNACADASNSKQGNFSVADCDLQDTKCKAA